jgi:hypothetical protein
MGMNPRLLRPTASGFDPRRIAGLALWLDASDGSTVFDAVSGGSPVAPGGAVWRWEDKSGNGRHFTQSTTNNHPTYTGTLNGRNVITFDGSNDELRRSGIAHSALFDATGGVSLCVFTLNNDNVYTVVATGDTASRDRFSNNGSFHGSFRNTRFENIIIGVLPTTGSHIFGSRAIAGGDHTMRLNKSVIFTGADDFANFRSKTNQLWQIGTGNQSDHMDGSIAEIIFYGRGTLSDAEIAQLENYLAKKWGLP